jgi:hypothetical protein
MLALKWIYQTVVRDGRPVFWPIRGAYGHNVWAREGLSGAGYFAIGMGAVRDKEKSAMKWYYDRFFREADARDGMPYDTVSRYPHAAVCAFVNWPTEIASHNPAAVLPHCYRDSSCGFYAWRNRWQDEHDTVITVLTNKTEGYMAAKPDKSLCLNTGGERIKWGTVKSGPTRHWWASSEGHASTLTLSDGTSFAVDFTGSSGSDVMLVTTGEAQGQTVEVDGSRLTFFFPTCPQTPEVKPEANAAVVGKQRVTMVDGNLVLSITAD